MNVAEAVQEAQAAEQAAAEAAREVAELETALDSGGDITPHDVEEASKRARYASGWLRNRKARVERAREAEEAAARAALADEVAEYGDSNPGAVLAESLEMIREAGRRYKAAAEAHNAAIRSFSVRARALGSPTHVPANETPREGLSTGSGTVSGDDTQLGIVDTTAAVIALASGGVTIPATPVSSVRDDRWEGFVSGVAHKAVSSRSAKLNYTGPRVEFIRSTDGSTVTYPAGAAPGVVQRSRLGLTPISEEGSGDE